MTTIDNITNRKGLTLAEKRSPKRFCVGLRGAATFESDAVERKVLSRNISGYGAYLLTDTCPEIGEDVEVYLDKPADPSQPKISLGAVGTVLRVDQLSERRYGFAVKFDVSLSSLAPQSAR
jgi:hypothetical protein